MICRFAWNCFIVSSNWIVGTRRAIIIFISKFRFTFTIVWHHIYWTLSHRICCSYTPFIILSKTNLTEFICGVINVRACYFYKLPTQIRLDVVQSHPADIIEVFGSAEAEREVKRLGNRRGAIQNFCWNSFRFDNNVRLFTADERIVNRWKTPTTNPIFRPFLKQSIFLFIFIFIISNAVLSSVNHNIFANVIVRFQCYLLHIL